MNEAWYCGRTKPKHEHIAAANIVRQLGLEVFNPRLRVGRPTQRGLVRKIEPLFPCYVFIHCTPQEWNSVRYVTGVSSLVHFGNFIPSVPDAIIDELRTCFENEEPLVVEDSLKVGSEVIVTNGAFRGFSATVLKTLPARQRVQVLLEILGQPTVVEVDRYSLSVENPSLAASLPALAAAV